MKKSLFGYNVDEVNQNIEYFESQIETLTAKVSNLNAELVAKDEIIENIENTSNKSVGTGVDIASFKKRIANLESINKKSADENTALFNENENLKRQLSELKRETKQVDDMTDVGKICKEAYSDMALVKKKTSEEIQRYINGFVEITEGHNGDITDAIEEIKRTKEFAQNSFIDSIEEMLNKFNEMSATNNALVSSLEKLNEIKNHLYNNINEYLTPPELPVEKNEEETVEKLEEVSTSTPLLYNALLKRKTEREQNNNDEVTPISHIQEVKSEKHNEDKETLVQGKANMGLDKVRLSIFEQK